MEPRDLLIYFHIIFQGDWEKIYKACKDRPAVTEEAITTAKGTYTKEHPDLTLLTNLDEDYPDALKKAYRHPFVLEIHKTDNVPDSFSNLTARQIFANIFKDGLDELSSNKDASKRITAIEADTSMVSLTTLKLAKIVEKLDDNGVHLGWAIDISVGEEKNGEISRYTVLEINCSSQVDAYTKLGQLATQALVVKGTSPFDITLEATCGKYGGSSTQRLFAIPRGSGSRSNMLIKTGTASLCDCFEDLCVER